MKWTGHGYYWWEGTFSLTSQAIRTKWSQKVEFPFSTSHTKTPLLHHTLRTILMHKSTIQAKIHQLRSHTYIRINKYIHSFLATLCIATLHHQIYNKFNLFCVRFDGFKNKKWYFNPFFLFIFNSLFQSSLDHLFLFFLMMWCNDLMVIKVVG